MQKNFLSYEVTTKFVNTPSDRCFIHYIFRWDKDQPSTDIGMVRYSSCLQHWAVPIDDLNNLILLSMKIYIKGLIDLLLSSCKNWSGLFAWFYTRLQNKYLICICFSISLFGFSFICLYQSRVLFSRKSIPCCLSCPL